MRKIRAMEDSLAAALLSGRHIEPGVHFAEFLPIRARGFGRRGTYFKLEIR